MGGDTKERKAANFFLNAACLSLFSRRIHPTNNGLKCPMILARRIARLIVSRRYSTDTLSTETLQGRITNLLNFIGHPDTDPSWLEVANLPTLDSAVAQLESITGSSDPPEDHALFSSPLNVAHPPSISLLLTLCFKVRSPADAEKASHLIITYLPYVSPDLRPPVLILMVHLLSAYRVLPALERVIKLFIGLPIFHEYWHFNRLLRALTLYTDFATDSRYIARLAVLLLKTMTERKLTLTRKTYRALLENRFVTMELTEELRKRMIYDKIVPDRNILESLLRVFAHHGSAQDAATYAHAILDQREKEPSDITFSKQPRPPESETKQILPSTTVEYLIHLVHENSLRPQFDATAEWTRFTKTGKSHRFRNKQKDTSAAAWAARLVSLSRTWSFTPESLVAFFDWSHAQRFPFRTHKTLSYTIVLRGLLRKRAYALALEVWERFRKHGTRKLHLDLLSVSTGVEVLTRAGHPDRALALIDSLEFGQPKARRNSETYFHGPTVPMSLVNRFMRALGEDNPSAALQLWEHMGVLYAATPDALSFTIMLDAARHATLNGDSFGGAMQELGFDLRLRSPFAKSNKTMTSWWSGPEMASTDADAESLDRARRRSYEKLEKSFTVNEGDMWCGERAWRRAHRIFTRALLAGWPALADVQAPAHAVRSSGERSATAPLHDLKSFLAPPRGLERSLALSAHKAASDDSFPLDDPPSDPTSTPLLPIHPHGAYPSFVPDDATFRAAVLLLGLSRCASQIPQIMAWMRALEVTPRVRTLAYALVFWAEVTMGAPLLERLRGLRDRRWGDDGGEYVRLVRWMEDWVGAENVPDEAAIGNAMRMVDTMRQRSSRS